MVNRGIFFAGCLVLSVLALMLAFGLAQIWYGAAVVLGVGLLGVFGWYSKEKTQSDWSIGLFWVGMVLLVAFGAFFDLNTVLLIIAVVGGLGAWDLVRFQKIAEQYSGSEDFLQLEKRHLMLLGITLLGGGILAVAVAFVRIQISFYLALVLGIILIFALSAIIRILKK